MLKIAFFSFCNWNLNSLPRKPTILSTIIPLWLVIIQVTLKTVELVLFYKNDLPIKIREDLLFDGSIVIEIVIGREKVFFTVIYKSPSHYHCNLCCFLNNFETLSENVKKDNPFAVFFAGDSNGHSQLQWNDGDTTAEGREIEQLTSLMGGLMNLPILNLIKIHRVLT